MHSTSKIGRTQKTNCPNLLLLLLLFLWCLCLVGACWWCLVGACWGACWWLPVGGCLLVVACWWCLLVVLPGACWWCLVPVGGAWCLLVVACWWLPVGGCLLVVPIGGTFRAIFVLSFSLGVFSLIFGGVLKTKTLKCAPALQTPPKIHEKTPREGRKERILRREREKKKREILGLPPFGLPLLLGWGPTLLAPTILAPVRCHKLLRPL